MNQATFSKGFLDTSNLRFSSKNPEEAHIQKGDLLMASTGGGVLGKVLFFDDDTQDNFYADSHVSILRDSRHRNNMKFLYYYFQTRYEEINATMVKGSTNQTELQRNYLIAHEIDIPEKSQQDAIVSYLDKHINSINERICLRERELQTLNKLKQSEINSVVVRGLNTNVPMKDSGIPWIGVIPAHWEIKRMKDLFVESKSLSSTGQEDLLSVSEYYGVARRVDKMTEDEEYESRAESLIGYKLCRKNDLVINIMLAWKKGLGISDYEGIVSPAYAVYRSKHIVPHFYHYLLRSDAYIAEFKRNSKGIIDSRLRLYTERFYNISAVYPPIEEQQLIADYLDEKCQKIDEISENINRQIEKLKLLKKALINEIISGQRAIQ